MAKLSLYKKDELLQSLFLKEGKEYLIGRAEACDIVIPAGKGISRQHLRILSVGGVWRIEVLSKFGELYLGGQKTGGFNLDKDMEFEIPPYQFRFNNQGQLPVVKSQETLKQETPYIAQNFDEDRTLVGIFTSIAQLKLVGDNGEVLQIYVLEGDAWLAGRETSCSIFLDHPKVSRRQFEIYRQDEIYYIRDAGSSNGTLLNAQPLSSEDWTPLNSGDIIQILNWSMQFELRDSNYEQRLAEAAPMINSPIVINTEEIQGGMYVEQAPPVHNEYAQQNQVYDQHPLPAKKIEWNKKNIIRVASAVFVLLAIVGFFLMDDSGPKNVGPKKTVSKEKIAYEKLSPAKQDLVKEAYRLAQEYFYQGHYEMARQEILRVHAEVPAFEDSKDILLKAEQSIEKEAELARHEKEEKEKFEIEQKIQKQIEYCRAKVTPSVQLQDVDDCLSSVIQFNPEHPGIQALKAEVDQMISNRNAKDSQRAEYSAKVLRQRGLFEKAKSFQKSGKPLLAIKAYREVIDSKLPDPQSFKEHSKREIASIQSSIAVQQAVFESAADQAQKKGDLKSALIALRKAAELNPENEVIKGKVAGMLLELRKQMQTYYQEGILEESVGEVETAKNKWKKIIELSLPEEDYYKKSVIKLKKYGAM